MWKNVIKFFSDVILSDKFYALLVLFFTEWLINNNLYGTAVLAFGAFILGIANWIVSEIKKDK